MKIDNKEKVLNCIFAEPDKSFHIRLLGRLTKLHPNTIITITDELVKEGYITKELDKETKFSIIKANTSNRMYKLTKQYMNVKNLYESGLIDFLNEQYAYPAIILFGSYAKAENTKKSDIDLFIITDVKQKADISSFYAKLDAEIQTFVHTKQEFQKLKKTNPELINNVLNGVKLEGYVEAV